MGAADGGGVDLDMVEPEGVCGVGAEEPEVAGGIGAGVIHVKSPTFVYSSRFLTSITPSTSIKNGIPIQCENAGWCSFQEGDCCGTTGGECDGDDPPLVHLVGCVMDSAECDGGLRSGSFLKMYESFGAD